MSWLFVIPIIVLCAFVPAPALAEPPEVPITYDFDDDLVDGALVRPGGEILVVRRRGSRRSLIRPRTHFVPELVRAAEAL
jgi:hypothetical protein